MKVSDYISNFLYKQGVRQVFGMTGGMVTHFLDSIHKKGNIRIIAMHHEQAAAFSAEAVGRMTGIPGVAFATSGPGATNLITGIGSCYFDSVPAVFITGQVNRNELKKKRSIRQLGFQETDIVSIARPITKAVWLVKSPENIPDILHDAFETALSDRPGPVLLDIPMDVQRAEIDPSVMEKASDKTSVTDMQYLIEDFFKSLSSASTPLFLAGGGLRAAGAVELFRALLGKIKIPVCHSLMGVDTLPSDNPLRVGMIGTYGNRWANMALSKADFLCVLGSRLDIRQTGADVNGFRANKKIFHVDCDPGEINNRVKDCRAANVDLKQFLVSLAKFMDAEKIDFQPEKSWPDKIDNWKRSYPDTRESEIRNEINPNVFMHQLSEKSGKAKAFVVDVGQHQMWAAQSLELEYDQRFLTSGGMGSMGFSLPTAIGASLITAPHPVVMIAGDGGFQCNIQELETVARNKLPIKMVVINNRNLGMVRQFQEDYFESRFVATRWGYSTPDFSKICEAYGISGNTVEYPGDVEKGLNWLWEKPEKASLLQVMIHPDINIYPKIAFGRPINEMEPLK